MKGVKMNYTDEPGSFLGRGLKFPVQVDKVTGRFMLSAYEEDIKEAIFIILNTRPGERPMRPAFGCRIHDYMFEALNYTVIVSMEAAVREALLVWEPRITDIEVKADAARADRGIVDIHISYLVRQTNNPFNLVYPFYLNESQGAGETL